MRPIETLHMTLREGSRVRYEPKAGHSGKVLAENLRLD
jgi:hypothetical protein